jgi:hypothetical protein
MHRHYFGFCRGDVRLVLSLPQCQMVFFNSASELKSVVKAAPVLGDLVIFLKTNLLAATEPS